MQNGRKAASHPIKCESASGAARRTGPDALARNPTGPRRRLSNARALLYLGLLDVGLPRRANATSSFVFGGDGTDRLDQDGILATPDLQTSAGMLRRVVQRRDANTILAINCGLPRLGRERTGSPPRPPGRALVSRRPRCAPPGGVDARLGPTIAAFGISSDCTSIHVCAAAARRARARRRGGDACPCGASCFL